MRHAPSVQDPLLLFLMSETKRMSDHDARVKDRAVSVRDQGPDGAGESVQDERGDEGDDGIVGKTIQERPRSPVDEFLLKLIALVHAV